MTDDIVSQHLEALKNRRIAPAVLIPPIGDGRLHSGTNIPGNVGYWYAVEPGPRWFLPSANTGTDDWAERVRRVRQRVDQFSIHAERSKATLVQSHYPGMPSTADESFLKTGTDGDYISVSDGLSLSPVIGFGHREIVMPTELAISPWAFTDPNGQEILDPNSTPIPCRLGLNRMWRVDHWSGPLARLIEEASEALLSMPGNIAAKYWELWPQGFSVKPSNYIWVDLLFECGWRTGRIRRHVQIAKPNAITHLSISGPDLFPTVDSVVNPFKALGQVIKPQESFRGNGDYVNGFVCTIEDIVSESMRLLDEILAGAADEPSGIRGTPPTEQYETDIKTGLKQQPADVPIRGAKKGRKRMETDVEFLESRQHIVDIIRDHHLDEKGQVVNPEAIGLREMARLLTKKHKKAKENHVRKFFDREFKNAHGGKTGHSFYVEAFCGPSNQSRLKTKLNQLGETAAQIACDTLTQGTEASLKCDTCGQPVDPCDEKYPEYGECHRCRDA